MACNYTCKFKVTKAQFERIRENALAKGYVRIAPYLRDLALEKSATIESLIVETHKLTKKILDELK